MPGQYVGHVDRGDPLYGYLRQDILPGAGVFSREPRFRVFRLSGERGIYLYEEKHSGLRVVGKFYKGAHGLNASHAPQSSEHEYRNLVWLRSLGFDRHPARVVRPLGCNPGLGELLVLEHLDGELLGSVIEGALWRGGEGRLMRKLSGLACFLATLHNRTAAPEPVDFRPNLAYLERIVGYLEWRRGLSRERAAELCGLARQWAVRPCMAADRRVMVHGDATPSNFLFGRGGEVQVIDLERMHHNDRAHDVGRLCGELKHCFLAAAGDPDAAEPFIGHFLWEYARHFPDHERTFATLTLRIPFYLGTTLLRIARNPWIGGDHVRRLFREAKKNLRALP